MSWIFGFLSRLKFDFPTSWEIVNRPVDIVPTLIVFTPVALDGVMDVIDRGTDVTEKFVASNDD